MPDLKIILDELKTELRDLYGPDLKAVKLYGSWARDEATADSDIDIMVILAGEINPGQEIDRMLDPITKLNLKYNTLISIYPISVQNFATVNSPILLNVRRESVPV